MPYILSKGKKTEFPYLGFDEAGHHEWKGDRLDAIRYDTEKAIRECCVHFIATGAKVVPVDEWDGHYEIYKDYEIQVYNDGLNRIRGGKRWRYRVGALMEGRAFEHSPSTYGFTSPIAAIEAAKACVDKKPRVEQLVMQRA